MLTIKLVVIGASGVGKTSLRGQYISGQFSTGYRATIGADFIAKTLPHPHIPDESITLQIWDTAGQERFAALASAFYRGADAVLLMFDVNRPETLAALRSSWAHFCACTRLEDVGDVGGLGNAGDTGSVCVVVVGNKMDLVGTEHGAPQAVPPACAWDVIHEMMPGLARPPSLVLAHDHTDPDFIINIDPKHDDYPNPNPDSTPDDNSMIRHTQLCKDHEDSADIDGGGDAAQSQHAPSESIAIRHHSHSHSHSPLHSHSHSHSQSHSRFDTGTTASVRTVNTMHTMRSAATIYHTPASSLSLSSASDIFHSARTSPEHSLFSSSSSSHSYSSSSLPLRANSPNATSTRARRNTGCSTSSASSDGATITPGMLARGQRSAYTLSMSTALSTHTTTTTSTDTSTPSAVTPSGPRLFYTSAKTGAGVGGVFEAVVGQVVGRWAREEEQECGGCVEVRDAGGGASGSIKRGRNVEAGLDLRLGAREGKLKEGAGCCG